MQAASDLQIRAWGNKPPLGVIVQDELTRCAPMGLCDNVHIECAAYGRRQLRLDSVPFMSELVVDSNPPQLRIGLIKNARLVSDWMLKSCATFANAQNTRTN